MMKNVSVRNFRSLKEVNIQFEGDITVLVGENDSGKTSVIDALKIFFENENVETDDFYYGTDEIYIETEIDELIFVKKFLKDEENIQSETMIRLDDRFLRKLMAELNSDNFKSLDEKDKRNKLENHANILGVSFRSNIGTDTLRERVLKKIDEILTSENRVVESNIPSKSVYFLDGKHFEDVSTFFREMFFKEKRREIWNEEIGGKTIEEVIKEKLDKYSETLKAEIEQRGITDKLRNYLPELTEILIRPLFEPQSVNIGVNVQLLEGDKEISIEKKGDGTRRRITMALLEYKKSLHENEPSLYVFDEPDTHLHVRAQVELLNIIHQFCDSGKQIVIATHSPFIMNSMQPRQIKLLSLRDRETEIKPISPDRNVEWILRNLGIENVHLFFSKKILIVEGKTEEVFIPSIYEKLYEKTLYSSLVKLVSRGGITDVPRFAEVLSEFVKPEDIFVLIDNDADEETKELIRELKIADDNIFEIGYREFEDIFAPEIIFAAWKKFVEDKEKCIGDNWTIENIRDLREKCIKERGKFSMKLRKLNESCLVGMKKPNLAQALAEYCEEDDLPKKIRTLLRKLR